MELQFKHVSGQQNIGDFTWIHQSGRQALIADLVSGSEVLKGIDLLKSWLTLHQQEQPFDAKQLVESLHNLFETNGVQATLGIVTKLNAEFEIQQIGNVRLYKVENEITRESDSGFENQPTSVIGSEAFPIIHTFNFSAADNETKFILTTDGLDVNRMCDLRFTSQALSSGQLASKFLPAVIDQDWSALIFPMTEAQSFVSDAWPYNPFIGPQEERIHERRGLAEIATELFNEPMFDGFRVVSCPPILSENSSRLFDGLLIYPYGVIPLELKDHHGNVAIDMETNKRSSLLVENDEGRTYMTNPVTKLRESMRRFGDLSQVSQLQPELKNAGLVVFTSKHVELECVYKGQKFRSPFMEAGEIMVTTTSDITSLLLKYCRSRFGKKLKRRLSESEINQLVTDLTTSTVEKPANVQLVGDYEVESELVECESTDYFSVYNAKLFHEKVWAKCFKLDHMSAVHQQNEIRSLGRESIVLKRLSRVDGVQRYQDKELVGDSFYVFVEQAPKQNLFDWLQTTPSREARLELLIAISKTIQQIQSVGEPKIIHRAINLSNIRVDNNDMPILINFELCQQEIVATLPLNARRSFEQKYQAPEVNEPGQTLGYTADIFSLGLIIFYVLTGELPFSESAKELVAKSRRPAFWNELCGKASVPPQNKEFWQRILHVNPTYRPTVEQILETLASWK